MTLLELPSRREEAWRWSDLSALPDLVAADAKGAVPGELPWIDCALDGPRLLFVDGELDRARSRQGPLEAGDLDIEVRDHPLGRLAGRSGWRLRLGAGKAAPGLVQIIHLSTGAADHLAGQVQLAPDSQASIVETYIGNGWTNRLGDFALEDGARLMLSRRLIGNDGFVSLTDQATIGKGASLVVATLTAGTRDSRLDSLLDLVGDGAFAEFTGALLARRRQRHDANVVLRHSAPNGTSRQVWRSVADDRAICSVAARVEVAAGAQKTDAGQSLKGLLLARGATINAKPELEIFADDVKCAHGATVGQLDLNALYYLASRGIPPADATALLTRAFVADAINRIGEDAVKEAFHASAQEWLG